VTDEELDTRFAALRDVEPPAAVQRATLRAVADLRERPRRRLFLTFAVAMAAGLALALRSGAPAVGDLARMTPRGAGESASAVDLRVAVRTSAGVSRLERDRAYAAGDTLLFRVYTSTPADVRLTRDGALLYAGAVPAGETDLPIGYTLEAGEGAAVFRLSAADAATELRIPAVKP
jgi:hypothetical protein